MNNKDPYFLEDHVYNSLPSTFQPTTSNINISSKRSANVISKLIMLEKLFFKTNSLEAHEFNNKNPDTYRRYDIDLALLNAKDEEPFRSAIKGDSFLEVSKYFKDDNNFTFLTEDQIDYLYNHWSAIIESIEDGNENRPHLVMKYVQLSSKITVILTVLRLLESRQVLSSTITSLNIDFFNALAISRILYKNVESMYILFSKKDLNESRDVYTLINKLPIENDIYITEILEIWGIPDRTAYRRIEFMIDMGCLARVRYGVYRRLDWEEQLKQAG